MNNYVHKVYDVTLYFPKNELFSTTSQYRRAALLIILNYVEGYARRRKAVLKNFLEISFGSLKESEYLTTFSFEKGYLNPQDRDSLYELEREIGAMLWGTLEKL